MGVKIGFSLCGKNIILTVFQNTVLTRISGPKGGEITGGWRQSHIEELHNLYSSPNSIRVIKSRRMRWARYEAFMSDIRMRTQF
jgi:hypothetical protein